MAVKFPITVKITISEKEIADNAKKLFAEILQERMELEDEREFYKDQSEWHRMMLKYRTQQYLLEKVI